MCYFKEETLSVLLIINTVELIVYEKKICFHLKNVFLRIQFIGFFLYCSASSTGSKVDNKSSSPAPAAASKADSKPDTNKRPLETLNNKSSSQPVVKMISQTKLAGSLVKAVSNKEGMDTSPASKMPNKDLDIIDDSCDLDLSRAIELFYTQSELEVDMETEAAIEVMFLV